LSVIDVFASLNEKNRFYDPSSFAAEFESIARSYGFVSDDDYPEWIKEALSCIVEKKRRKQYFEEKDEVYNLLEHLQADFDWDIDNEGEWTLLVFPRSKMTLYISREALSPETGRGCSSWEAGVV
jgi:hypothetical protein